MKKLLLILILAPNFIFSQINEDEYYNISNFFLNILKIDKGEYLFYGDKGVVVRTYDYGETFVQNYSGTKNWIINLKNHRNYIVGITKANEFMASQDKGSHWTVNQLADSLIAIDANNDFIVIATDYQNILISSDVGKNWQKIKVNDNYFLNVFLIKNRIFLTSTDGTLIYSDDWGKNWSKLETPFSLAPNQYYAKKVGEKLTFKTIYSLYELNDDLSFTEYDFGTMNYGVQYAKTRDEYIFAVGDPNYRKIDIYSYDINNKVGTKVSHFTNNYFYGNAFWLVDIMADSNVVIMTCENRAIIKSNDYGRTWEVMSYSPLFESNSFKFWDEKNWSIVSSSIIYKSTDSGATFKPGEDDLIDVTDSTTIRSFINSFHYFNKDSAIYFITHQFHNTTKNEVYTTNNGGETLIGYEPELFESLHFIADMNDYLLVSRGWGLAKVIFYKLSDGFKLDSISCLDTLFHTQYQTVRFDNKIYVFYSKNYDQGYSPDNATIAVSDDSLKTLRDIYSFEDNNTNTFHPYLKSKNGNIYFIHNSSMKDTNNNWIYNIRYLRLDTKTNKVYEVKEPFSIGSFYRYSEYIEDQKYFRATKFDIKDTSYEYKYVEVTVDGDELVYDTVGNNNSALIPVKLINSDYLILLNSIQSIYKKISPDRLTSVSQIENVSETIQVWPFTPTPNPAKGKINVKFYTEARNRIKDLKVSLVNIASGKEQEIKDYDMSFSDNWNGEITFDISGYSVGSYLLNLSIGDYSRSTKLIISR